MTLLQITPTIWWMRTLLRLQTKAFHSWFRSNCSWYHSNRSLRKREKLLIRRWTTVSLLRFSGNHWVGADLVVGKQSLRITILRDDLLLLFLILCGYSYYVQLFVDQQIGDSQTFKSPCWISTPTMTIYFILCL